MKRKMSREELFETNLQLWAPTHPKEAVMLQFFECETLELCEIKKGLWNIKKDGEFLLNQDPIREAEEWAAQQDLSDCDVLYLYGAGLGYYYPPLKKWLKKDQGHHVVFLEDDLEVVARLFETPMGTDLLSDPQVSLLYFREVAETEYFFNQLYWNFPMSKIAFSALGSYKRKKEKIYSDLCHQISYDAALKDSLLEEYLQYGIAFYRNFYPNLLRIQEASLGNALFGKFGDMPAIICGAGPSLKKNISLLKQLKGKAILFAGSSALNALGAEGIQPHLGAGIDPNPMQEERLKQVSNLNFPFLYRNRVHPGALRCVTGPKLYVTGAGGYEVAEWFEKKFGIDEKFIEEGRNVVNFCLEIAYEMGCNPIIFVGMDLAYTGMQTYTSGVVSDTKISKKEKLLKKTDIHGEEVFTEWKWVAEAKWIGDFAKAHPEVRLVNATEGGIGFPGVPNIPLAEVSKKELKKKITPEKAIAKVVAEHNLAAISKERISEALDELKNSLEKCINSLDILLEENDKIKAKIKKTKKAEQTQSGRAALVETELADEPAFGAVLQIFNDVSSRWLQKDLRKIYNPLSKTSAAEKELQKLDLNTTKYNFLRNAAIANLQLLEKSRKSEV